MCNVSSPWCYYFIKGMVYYQYQLEYSKQKTILAQYLFLNPQSEFPIAPVAHPTVRISPSPTFLELISSPSAWYPTSPINPNTVSADPKVTPYIPTEPYIAKCILIFANLFPTEDRPIVKEYEPSIYLLLQILDQLATPNTPKEHQIAIVFSVIISEARNFSAKLCFTNFILEESINNCGVLRSSSSQ